MLITLYKARGTPAEARQTRPYNRGMRATRLVVFTFVAAVVVFAVVQDRLTASAARQYVRLQEAAASGAAPAVTIDEVMKPGVRHSVRVALLWSGAVMTMGLAATATIARRSRRE
jgi:hypothetical protein